MRCVSWLAAASLVVVTAGCVEQSGYPTTYGYSPGYGSNYGNSGYSGYSNNYVSQPTYYRPAPTYYAPPPPPPQVITQTRYVPVPVAPPRPSYPAYHRPRDSDRDGIPDRYDRDKNGDGVPDKYQRSRW